MTNSLFTPIRGTFKRNEKKNKCNDLFSLDHKLKLSLWIINELNFKISFSNGLNREVDRLIFLNLISTLSLKPYTKVLRNWFSSKCQLCQVQTVKRMQRDDLDERKPPLTMKEPHPNVKDLSLLKLKFNINCVSTHSSSALLPAPAQRNARSEKTWTNNSVGSAHI